ncbi:RHS repeat-associated core domain-containing protein, partial [Photorhabdus sp. MH8.4]
MAALASAGTIDPLGLNGGPNPYAYVHNPANWIDPLGLSGFFTPSIFNAPSGS